MSIIYAVDFYYEKNNSITKMNITDSRLQKIQKVLNTSNFKKETDGLIQTITNSKYFISVSPVSVKIAFREKYELEKAVEVLEVFVERTELSQIIVSVRHQIQCEPFEKVFSVLSSLVCANLSKFTCTKASFFHTYEGHVVAIDISLTTSNEPSDKEAYINIDSQCFLDEEDCFEDDYFDFILNMYNDDEMIELKRILGDENE